MIGSQAQNKRPAPIGSCLETATTANYVGRSRFSGRSVSQLQGPTTNHVQNSSQFVYTVLCHLLRIGLDPRLARLLEWPAEIKTNACHAKQSQRQEKQGSPAAQGGSLRICNITARFLFSSLLVLYSHG